jgi:hypothetical protein
MGNLTQLLLADFWRSVSFGTMAWHALLGILLGALLGLLFAWQLHRQGWIGRCNRWHHLLLKTYFLLLPACGAWIGLQGGLLHSAEQQAYARIDRFQPQVQALADAYLTDFQRHVAALDLDAMKASESSVQDLIDALVRGYLQQHPLPGSATRGEASLWHRAGLRLLDGFRESLLSKALTDALVSKASGYSGLDKDMLAQLTTVRLGQLFDAGFLLGLVKQQVASMMHALYVGVGLQLALVLAAVALEWGVSRYFRQHRTQHKSAAPFPVGPSTGPAAAG